MGLQLMTKYILVFLLVWNPAATKHSSTMTCKTSKNLIVYDSIDWHIDEPALNGEEYISRGTHILYAIMFAAEKNSTVLNNDSIIEMIQNGDDKILDILSVYTEKFSSDIICESFDLSLRKYERYTETYFNELPYFDGVKYRNPSLDEYEIAKSIMLEIF